MLNLFNLAQLDNISRRRTELHAIKYALGTSLEREVMLQALHEQLNWTKVITIILNKIRLTSDESQELFEKTASEHLRQELLQRYALPFMFDLIFKHKQSIDFFVFKSYALQHPRCPAVYVQHALYHTSGPWRNYAAINPNLPLRDLNLAIAGDVFEAYANPSCPEHILREGYANGHAQFVVTNPNCPRDLLLKEVNQGTEWLKEILRNPNLPEAILRHFWTIEPTNVLHNPNCPLDLLFDIDKNEDYLIELAVSHPRANAKILFKYATACTRYGVRVKAMLHKNAPSYLATIPD